MKYAVVKIAGFQYRVAEGDVIEVPNLGGKKGEKIDFPEVLLLSAESLKIGTPYVTHAKVQAEVLENLKGKKIRVAVYKAKSRYRRLKGFRPQLTRIKISKITS